MGYCRNITIICMIGVLSLYGAEAQIAEFTAPVAGPTEAGRVTTGVTAGTAATTAAVTIPENTVNSDGVIATVHVDGSTMTSYYMTTAPTIFQINDFTGVITVSGTHTASVSGSPYTLVVEAVDEMVGIHGTLTLTITVEPLSMTSPPTLPPRTSPPTLPPTTSPPTTCLLTGDKDASLTTLSTYSTSTESGETTTYTLKMLTQSSQDSWTQQQQLFKRLCYLGFMTARSPIQAQLMRLCLHGNYYPSLWHDWTPEK